MVKDSDLRRVRDITIETSEFLQYKLKQKDFTVQDVQKWLDRSYGYTYNRITGKNSINIDELEIIAKHIGYYSILDFFNAQYEYFYPPRYTVTDFKEETLYDINDDTSTLNTSEIQLAAHHDHNKHAEQELDDFGA